MGTPSQVQPVIPSQPAPQVAQTPPASARPSLDEIFGQQASAQPLAQQRPSLDEIFGSQVQAAPQADSRSFGEKVVDDAKDIIFKPLEIASDVGKAITAPFEGAAAAVATQFNDHPLKTIIDPMNTALTALKGAGNGVMHPLSQPDFGASLNKAFPATKNMSIDIPAPNPDGPIGDPNDPVFKQKITPAQALDLAANLMIPEVAIGGAAKVISKAPEIAKLVGQGIAPLVDALKSVKTAGKLEAAVEPLQTVTNNVDSIKNAIKGLEDIGVKIPLTADMENGASQEAVKVAKAVKDNKTYRSFVEEIGNRIYKLGTEDIPALFSNIKNTTTHDDILNMVKDVKSDSGKRIQELKGAASEFYGESPVQAPEFKSRVTDLLDKATTPDTQSALYIEEGSKKKEFFDFLKKVDEEMHNSPEGLPFNKWESYYKTVSEKASAAWATNSETKGFWSNLRSGLSHDQNGMLADGLKEYRPDVAKEFLDSKSAYATYMDASHDLKNFLNKDDVTGNSFIKTMMADNVGSADKVNSFIKVLSVENPEAVKDFRSLLYNFEKNKFNLKEGITDKNPFGFDFNGFANRIEELGGIKTANSMGERGTNMLDLMTGNEKASEAALNMSKVMKSFANAYTGRGDMIVKETLLGRMFYYAKNITKADGKNLLSPVLDAMERDENLRKAFSSMDINEIVKGFPPNQRADALSYVKKILKK